MKISEAKEIVGGALSRPSKMPGAGFGLPATACITGSWLHKIPKSVCSGCYALKGRYGFKKVAEAQHRRLAALNDARWVDAMVTLIGAQKSPWFRWHDSGDLQSIEHLENIAEVAKRLPQVRFWLPTREKSIVRAYDAQYGDFPPNLTVRVSGTMIDGRPPGGFALTSTVVTENPTCVAPTQGNVCGSCRQCWDKNVPDVSYLKH